jgi:hypothetical protein
MVRHVDYPVERIGIDRVGFGSDFDGVLISRETGGVSGLPRLLSALRDRATMTISSQSSPATTGSAYCAKPGVGRGSLEQGLPAGRLHGIQQGYPCLRD